MVRQSVLCVILAIRWRYPKTEKLKAKSQSEKPEKSRNVVPASANLGRYDVQERDDAEIGTYVWMSQTKS